MTHFFRVAIIGILLLIASDAYAAQTCTWTGATNNSWSTDSNWTGSVSNVHPVAGDAVIFNNAVNCDIDHVGGAAFASIDCTGYTGTLTQSVNVASSGNVTLVSGMTFTYSSGTWTFGGGTITSGGKVFGVVTFGTAATYTLGDDMNIDGTFTTSAASVINDNKIYASGNFAQGTGGTSGTTEIVMDGSGKTWTSTASAAVQNNLTLTGTITVSGTVYYKTGTLTTTAGTITTTSSTLNIRANATLDTNGTNWNNVTFVGTAATITLSSTLSVDGTLTITGSTIINSNSVYASGSVTVNAALSGTATLVMDGTGTWSAGNYLQSIANNLTINTAGTITIGTYAAYKTGTFTYTAGTVTTTSSLFYISGGCTLNVNGINWNNVESIGVNTVTLSSNLSVDGTLTLSNALTLNGNTAYLSGSLTETQPLLGTTNIILDGTGTWTGGSSTGVANNLTINTAGTITLSANVYYKTGTLTYITGTVNATTNSSTLNFSGSCTVNTSGMNWYNIDDTGGGNTITLSSDLHLSNNLKCTNGSITYSGNTIYAGGITTSAYNINNGSPIILNGTGTWSSTGTGSVQTNLTINTAGTVTVSGNVYYRTGTLTYTAGTLTVAGSTLNLINTCTLSGGTWNNVSTTTAGTCTLGGALDVNGVLNIGASTTLNCAGYQLNCAGDFTRAGTFTHGNNTTVFDGTSTVAGATTFFNLTLNPGSTVHLTSSQTFTVSGTFNAQGTGGSGITLDAVTPDTQAALPVTTLGTVSYTTATDIDSSGGVEILDTNGTLDNATNWITAAPAGWAHSILGIANANIGKINGIAKTDIAKVNGI